MMRYFRSLLLAAAIICTSHVQLSAQDVLLEEQPFDDPETKVGPNRKFYFQTLVHGGVGPQIASFDTTGIYGLSWSTGVDSRYKLKLTNMFSIGADIGIHNYSVLFNQDAANGFQDSIFWGGPITHQREYINVSHLGIYPFLRINFDPGRGDFLGYFLDIGAGYGLQTLDKYVAIDNRPDDIRVKTKMTKLPYFAPLELSAYGRLGFNWFAIGARYRVSTLYAEKYGFPEPTPVQFFLEIATKAK
jgi:hypothetical protein